jgi:predicted NACHT family NTPase
MAQPIELTGERGIYTNVNILEKITGRRRLDIAELVQNCNPEDFDRFGLNKVTEKRVPGLEAVQRYSKLMVLGKPGAGKTTFLKYLAMQCIEGQFQANLVPLFITLKDFAETPKQADVIEYIAQQLSSCGVKDTCFKAEQLLRQGRALVLLDGLDEVRDEDNSRVIRQIREFATQLGKNYIVVTCRIAAREYVFERFTEVEVADFDDQQISTFATQWFQVRKPAKAEKFLQRLEESTPIKELATNPLLLTLLCLIFEEKGKFKNNRTELYEEGIELLLEKWDDSRDIEREHIYRNLSTRRKEDLLSKIALATFTSGDYFFKNRDAEQLVSDYIYNLPDAQTDPEALYVDSKKVLKSVEAQHGLLVERARGIYSFSHLTFQEYFAAREIKERAALVSLVEHITEKRWREVFLLTAGMMRKADELMWLMKQKIDELLARDEKLQRFLEWVDKKTRAIEGFHKLVGIRAFYFRIEVDDLSLPISWEFTPDIEKIYDIEFTLDKRLSLDECIAHILDLDEHKNQSFITASSYATEIQIYLECCNEPWFPEHRHDNWGDIQIEMHHSISEADSYMYEIVTFFEIACNLTDKKELINSLQELKDQLPVLATKLDRDTDRKLIEWWETDGQTWTEQLRSVMIEHRNIGHDWQFTDAQKQLLQQYYDANKLLMDCLNSDCYVSREVRQEIEDTLLLPMSEIEKRQQGRVS